jgi:hypothetical protein
VCAAGTVVADNNVGPECPGHPEQVDIPGQQLKEQTRRAMPLIGNLYMIYAKLIEQLQRNVLFSADNANLVAPVLQVLNRKPEKMHIGGVHHVEQDIHVLGILY